MGGRSNGAAGPGLRQAFSPVLQAQGFGFLDSGVQVFQAGMFTGLRVVWGLGFSV